jgi:hypothetical protein
MQLWPRPNRNMYVPNHDRCESANIWWSRAKSGAKLEEGKLKGGTQGLTLSSGLGCALIARDASAVRS